MHNSRYSITVRKSCFLRGISASQQKRGYYFACGEITPFCSLYLLLSQYLADNIRVSIAALVQLCPTVSAASRATRVDSSN